jgi:DNA-binding transcriptional ArsR family regulator
MSKHAEPIPRKELPALTPHLAQAYAGTERTLSRDLNALRDLELIERVPGGWKPRRELILAFLPLRRIDLAPAEPG